MGGNGDAGTKAGPHQPKIEKEQSDCQDLPSPGLALRMRRVLGRDRKQPAAAVNRAALPSVLGAPGAGADMLIKTPAQAPMGRLTHSTMPSPILNISLAASSPLPRPKQRDTGLRVTDVLGHLSLAPGPGGIQRHATKRPAPATRPQLARHEGEISAGRPSKAAGKSTVGTSSSQGFYLTRHLVSEGSPPGPAT